MIALARRCWLALAAFTLITPSVHAQMATIPPAPGPQAGQKVALYCDSVLQPGWDRPGGFLSLLGLAFTDQERPIVLMKPGVGANVSSDLLGRLKKEVLDAKPDWLVLSCGGNDAARGVPLDKFRASVSAIVDQASAAGIKVVILTAPMMGEDAANAVNQKLIPYTDFLRGLAKDKNLPLADLNASMQSEIAQERGHLHLANPGNLLTIDGTHLNGLGQEMVADQILKAFGFTDAELAEARDVWLDQPGGMDLLVHGATSVRQYLYLRDLAASQGIGVDEMLNRAVAQELQTMLVHAVHPAAHKKTHAKRPHPRSLDRRTLRTRATLAPRRSLPWCIAALSATVSSCPTSIISLSSLAAARAVTWPRFAPPSSASRRSSSRRTRRSAAPASTSAAFPARRCSPPRNISILRRSASPRTESSPVKLRSISPR